MNTLNCLIIDDEPLARLQLRALLEEEPDIHILGEAGNINDAVPAIKRLQPNLLFLDIKMRGGGGFELLHALETPPPVIFVTAYSDFAVRAFEVNAVDYLLKPVAPDRLRSALDRVRNYPDEANAALHDMKADLMQLGTSGHFASMRDILFIRANGHYSEVALTNGSTRLVRQPFREWSARLPEKTFVKLDRGLIVNLARIKSCAHASRSVEIVFNDHISRLKAGSAAAKRLAELLL